MLALPWRLLSWIEWEQNYTMRFARQSARTHAFALAWPWCQIRQSHGDHGHPSRKKRHPTFL